MIIFFIAGLLLGGIAVIFALQNTDIVSVSFMVWQVEGSLSIIIILSILMGILITLLLTIPELIGNFFEFRSLKNKNKQLEEELRKQKELTHFAQKQAPTNDVLRHIEQGSTQPH